MLKVISCIYLRQKKFNIKKIMIAFYSEKNFEEKSIFLFGSHVKQLKKKSLSVTFRRKKDTRFFLLQVLCAYE